jgi:hypothetical protein
LGTALAAGSTLPSISNIGMNVIRFGLFLAFLTFPAFSALPAGCSSSAGLGTFRLWVRPSAEGMPLPIKTVAKAPEGAHLIWEPVHLATRSPADAEIAAVVLPEGGGELLVLRPEKAAGQAEWAFARSPAVIALIYGPHGLSEGKVKELVTHNQDLLSQLANYAEQASEVEALVQQLADSESSGSSVDAALKGFSSQYGVDLGKLDAKASADQQAVLLLKAVLPSANSYDPLSPRSAQMQQSAGLAASVAGLFFGNMVGLAAGGAALFQNLKWAFFPEVEFRSAFTQSTTGSSEMALCTKTAAAPKNRVRPAYLWAYRVPNVEMPSIALEGDVHLPLGSKSAVPLKVNAPAAIRNLSLAREWQLTPVSGGEATPVTAAFSGAPNSIDLDLSKIKLSPGDYELTALWDWEKLRVQGTLHLHPYGDFSKARLAPGMRDRLVQGNGAVKLELIGTDFEFVEKAALEKGEARASNPPETHFSLPHGKRGGEQQTIWIDVDTAAAGPYRLLVTQSDGVTHEIPFTVLPPIPKPRGLPIRINTGEPTRPICLEGEGVDRILEVSTPAGTVSGARTQTYWSGEVKLNANVAEGRLYPIRLRVEGHDAPVEIPDAIEIVPPRPKVSEVRTAIPGNLGIQIRSQELPAGTTVGFSLRIENLRPGGAAPLVEFGCLAGAERAPASVPAGNVDSGVVFLSVDPGRIGYPGCEMAATVSVENLGRSDPYPLGRVIRVPRLEQFTLTNEKVGQDHYAGILQGRDLDIVEKVGWDAQNGVPVDSIPVPVPGDVSKQTLKVALPWPAPAPHAPVYVWLRGEKEGRQTSVSN